MNITIKDKGVNLLLENLVAKIKLSNKMVGKLVERRLKNRVRSFSDSGKMLNSIELIVKAKSSEILIDVPYASIQDKGGQITITPDMRKKMWALYSTTGNEMYKRIAITKQGYIVIKGKHYIDDSINIKEIERQTLKFILE